ncbi:hypothetical protein ACFCZ3_20200 [Cellulosimicrobium cellulans]|uniref:hypothetical protein n=1 Tax=Cellulosimicrobium cellulans TaxID=1710 RepID=UPI0035D56A86
MSAPTLPVRARSAHDVVARASSTSADVRAFGMDVMRALSAMRAVDARVVERDGTDRRDSHLVLALVVRGRFGAVRVTFDARRRSGTRGSSCVRVEQERATHGVRVPLAEPFHVTVATPVEDVAVWLVLTLGAMPTEC